MFVSTKDQGGPRRRKRIYGNSEASGSKSSNLSLLSSFTRSSTSSGGSTSTITQDSYSKPRRSGRSSRSSSHSGQARTMKKRRSSSIRNEQSTESKPQQAAATPQVKDKKGVDVFEFMVEEKKPDKMERARSASVRSEPPNRATTKSDLLKSDLAKMVLPKSELVRSGSIKSEPVRSNSVKPEMKKQEPVKSESVRSESVKPEMVKVNPNNKSVASLEIAKLEVKDKKESREQNEEYDDDDDDDDSEDDSSDGSTDDSEDDDEDVEMKGKKDEASNEKAVVIPQRSDRRSSSEESDPECYYRSQLSDSGISMGSSTGDPHLDSFMKQPLPPLMEEGPEPSVYAPSIMDGFYHHEPHMWSHPASVSYTPEPMPLSPASIRSYSYPHEYAYRGTPEPPSTEESSRSCLDSTPLVFRNKSGSSNQTPQFFRSFSNINSKMLLQMQSSVADLEHEIAALDGRTTAAESSIRSRKGEHINHSRQFANYQARRAELYQELNTCLEQYYHALYSFHQVNQVMTPCNSTEKKNFKSWLISHVSPSSKAHSLFGNGSDVVRLGPRADEVSRQTFQVIAYSVFVNVFVPLLLFKIMSSVLSRLIVLSFVTSATVLVMDRHRAAVKLDMGNLHWHCITTCTAVCCFAALFF